MDLLNTSSEKNHLSDAEKNDEKKTGEEAEETTEPATEANPEPAATSKESKKKTAAKPFAEFFLSKDVSFSVEHNGYTRCYARKKFRMDGDNGRTIKLYIDPEVLSMAPVLREYYVLSAHFNPSSKNPLMSMCWVQHYKSAKRFVVLCYLRTKCHEPRYDIVVWSEDDGVLLWTGITKMKPFEFDFDTAVDVDALKKVLCDYLKEKHFSGALKNKDETGTWIVDGFDPVEVGVAAASASNKRGRSSRKRTTRVLHDAGAPVKKRKQKTASTKKAVSFCCNSCLFYMYTDMLCIEYWQKENC